jgi:hypothetical protein
MWFESIVGGRFFTCILALFDTYIASTRLPLVYFDWYPVYCIIGLDLGPELGPFPRLLLSYGDPTVWCKLLAY